MLGLLYKTRGRPTSCAAERNIFKMNNSITSAMNSSFYDRTKEANWIIPVTVTVLMLTANFWIIISLSHHGVKTGKWMKKRTKTVDKLSSGVIYSSVLVIAVFCFLRLLFSFVLMNIGFSENESVSCGAISDAVFVIYFFVVFSTAVFLWLRQRVFFTHPILKANYSKTVKFFSFASIVFIFVTGIIVLAVRRLGSLHLSSLEGCKFNVTAAMQNQSLNLEYGQPFYVLFVILSGSLGQVMLLCLFIYGMKKAGQTNTKAKSITISDLGSVENQLANNSNTAVFSPSHNKASTDVILHHTKPNSNELIKHILRKTLIFALCSVLFDIIAAAVATVYVQTFYRIVVAVYNVNAFFNLLFVILSFARSRQMLFSFCSGVNSNVSTVLTSD